MLANHLPPSFLDTYCLSPPFLGCKASCIVMGFLLLRSICWSSSLGHFKNGREYLTRRTAQVSSSFLVHLRYSFFNFFLSSLVVRWCPLPIFPRVCKFPFLRVFWFFFLLGSSIPLVFVVFRFSLWAQSICQMPSFYILSAYIKISNSFSFFCK